MDHGHVKREGPPKSSIVAFTDVPVRTFALGDARAGSEWRKIFDSLRNKIMTAP
jgi:hypothetical protein